MRVRKSTSSLMVSLLLHKVGSMSRVEQLLLDNGYEGVTFLENFDFDSALIGVTNDNRCCYDYNKMIQYPIEKQGFSEEEAIEWIDYNTIRALPYAGRDAPVIVFPLVDYDNDSEVPNMKIRYCNKCGKKFDMWDEQENYSIHTTAGYGSKHDGDEIELDLCCECMDELIASCKISPVKE